MDEGNTLVNAVIGAIGTVVLSGFVPLAPALGGTIAGYLEGGTRGDGIRVGAIAGAIALVPALLAGFGVMVLFGGFMMGMGGPRSLLGAGFGFVFLLIAFVFGLVYFVGLSAAGGWIGNYVKYDTDIGS